MNQVSIRLSMPNNLALVSSIRQFIGQVVREQGFGDEPAHDIEIALSEALSNVVEHGYPPHTQTYRIDVACEIDPQKCVLTLHDDGKVYDPGTAQLPTIAQQRRSRDFHLGTFYIKRCMDDIQYDTHAQRGNTLTMTKFRHAKAARLAADR